MAVVLLCNVNLYADVACTIYVKNKMLIYVFISCIPVIDCCCCVCVCVYGMMDASLTRSLLCTAAALQNPSVDLQAMARVWRQGQRLPVTVFRFVSPGTIEQSIMEVREGGRERGRGGGREGVTE
jgi:hypothetical protein